MSADQTGNSLGAGVSGAPAQQHTSIPQQGSPFSMSSPSVGGLDPMALNPMSMGSVTPNSTPRQTTPGLNPMTTGGGLLTSLAPKFPPQNFEVPDISFSNSVSPNMGFDQSLFSSAHNMDGTGALFQQNVTTTSGCMAVGSQPMTTSQTGMVGMTTAMTSSNPLNQSMMTSSGQPVTSFMTPVSGSPPGTSSSDDSDDLPLAQIALKRTASLAVSCTASGHPVSMPSTTTMSSGGPPVTATSSSGAPDMGGSPSDTSSLTGNQPPGKKAKASKRKKKKDPNEPQKPVSAYALFFRDTQATIKGHNPSASFGEVSKIVASMWDQLDPKHKDVYKKKTEAAKKLYLKQLAAYRASQVSQSAADESEKSPSPPGMGGNSVGVLQNPGMIHPVTTAGPGGPIMAPHMPVTVNGPMMHMPSPVMQQQQQQFMQHSQPQQLQMHRHHQQPMSGLSSSSSPPASLQHQQHSPPQQHLHHPQTAQLQQHQVPVATYGSPPQGNNNGYHQTPMVDHTTMLGFADPNFDMDMAYTPCVRSGCGNHAVENPAWDSEYCSNECVITHCRDVFTSWTTARSGSNTFPVK